ncbi:hypothetical protein JZ751_005736 [Albula glossodonta]|uniref:Major facilitator superfamily (MFS) profile domain-containing protein n=1 Tax=Albula glossodonta TaxID=121402 RepID=A0A8T2N8S3_9TELE|nr:hypothetical protein JZ751_005736 [Albula glossodonta]
MNRWGRTAKIPYEKWTNSEISVVRFKHAGNTRDSDGDGDLGEQEVQIEGLRVRLELTSASAGPHELTKPSPARALQVEDLVEAIGFGKFQWKLSILTGLAWMADAMEMMILSIIAPELHCDWRLPGWKVALITSVVFVGMMVSSPVWGNMCDQYGRKMVRLCIHTLTMHWGGRS